MNSSSLCLAILIGLAQWVGACLTVEAQAPLPLGPAAASSRDVFSRVVGLRELPDGRVLVSDALERRVSLLSADLQTAATLGRPGAGPGEYQTPGALLLFGDTTILVDAGNSRVHYLDASGRFVRDRSLVIDLSGFSTFPLVRAVDGLGRFYYSGMRSPLLDRSSAVAYDSAPVLRTGPRSGAIDTVAWYRLPVTPMASSSAGGSVQFTRARPDPFAWRDEWLAAPDGRVAVIRGDEYRVDWFDGGGVRTRGPVISVTPIVVTAEDREAAAPSAASNQWRSFGGGAPGVAPRRGAAPAPPPSSLAGIKPPFVANASLVDSRGRVWIQRSRAFDDPVPTYDVFDAGGAHHRVALPPRSRVVGFGESTVYVVTADDNDLLRLSRHSLPR